MRFPEDIQDSVEYDVVIVGAGPAGSTAARYAAMNGMRALLIEKRQDIGTPVRCGEGIAKTWLDKMGIPPNPEWIANEVKGAKIISPDGHVVRLTEKMAGNEVGYVVKRELFDKDLVKMAIKEGVEVMVKTSAIGLLRDENGEVSGIRARSMGKEFDVHAKIVIGADGFESMVGSWAGINTRLGLSDINTCYQYHLVGIDMDPNFNEFYVGSDAPGGYVWVFVKGKDEANVGIGLQASQLKNKGDVKRCLNAFIAKHPHLAKGKPIEEVAGAVSVCAPIDRTVSDHVMLVGDSARLIDPMTGGGIINAIISGKIAGKVAAEAVKKGDCSEIFLMKYDEEWREELEDRLLRNFIAKEKLVELSDDIFNKIIHALEGYEIEKITTLDILRAVQERYPEVIEELEDLL
ncbi:MAG: NAD(P)/FAD-dependent oxidoreductase [Thermoplasmata archaeon]|nr:NAD(P)/FAD-dependent oxidoreductase [Thermoplasmata archaeon]